MISASEPHEFIPRGRQLINYHPGPLKKEKPHSFSAAEEEALLKRMQKISISSKEEEPEEFYILREVVLQDADKKYSNEQQIFPYAFTEEELYVCGHTAVWTRSLGNFPNGQPFKSFTVERPIKFAFFCPRRFIVSKRLGKRTYRNGICLIDSKTLYVYCDTGETYGAEIACSLDSIWPTPFGFLLKRISDSSPQIVSEPTPRFFTLSYPTAIMKPLLVSLINDQQPKEITETEYQIIFSCEQVPLVVIYDGRTRMHSICIMRHTTNEELSAKAQFAANPRGAADTYEEAMCFSKDNFAADSKLRTEPSHSSATLVNLGGSVNLSSLTSFMQSILPNYNWLHSPFVDTSNTPDTPINPMRRGVDMLKPEFCIEEIWNEACHSSPSVASLSAASEGEMASVAFLHTNLLGVQYICYLQTSANILTLVELKQQTDTPVVVACDTIRACAAVALERLNLLIILDATGKLMLYSGPLPVGKVNVSGLPSTAGGVSSLVPNQTTWRRSSLLPHVVPSDSKFEEALHLLSPVRNTTAGGNPVMQTWLSFGDGTGTRFTISFDGGVTDARGNGRSFRVALPPLAESQLVRRCLTALFHVLPTSDTHDFLIRWYGTRNVPGSHAGFSTRQEWNLFKALLLSAMGRPTVATHAPSESTQERQTVFSPAPITRRSFAAELGNPSMSNPGVGWFAEEPKKRRRDENIHGAECDWEYLLQNVTQDSISMAPVEGQGAAGGSAGSGIGRPYKPRNSKSLYNYIPEIIHTLHLLYEELKLDVGLTHELELLGEFLFCVATDARASRYKQHYFLDFPELNDRYPTATCHIIDNELCGRLHDNSIRLPSIFRYLYAIIKGQPKLSGLWKEGELEFFEPYPCLPGINDRCRDVIVLITLMYREKRLLDWVQQHVDTKKSLSYSFNSPIRENTDELGKTVLQFLIRRGYERESFEDFPTAVRLLLSQLLEPFRENTMHWHEAEAYELLIRPELHQHALSAGLAGESLYMVPKRRFIDRERRYEMVARWLTDMAEIDAIWGTISIKEDPQRLEREDGMDSLDMDLLRLRFPYDKRINEVRACLTSSARVLIDIKQGPKVSDHDFIEDQERYLYQHWLRTLALPIGRGMFTLCTSDPAPAETVPVPRLCLTGRDPRGATIEVVQLEVPPAISMWPSFHNGVAAGLRVCTDAPNITSTWITNNRITSKRAGPHGNNCIFSPETEALIEHGGFLLALGLTGHLRELSSFNIFNYMMRNNELMRIGLLLGLSAARRGTEHKKTISLLAVHVEALLPPTAIELDVAQSLQVAAVFGVGLVYERTARRHIAEVLLQEIGRPPGPEMENSVERESYGLAAGLALGLVTLGHGDQLTGEGDVAIPGELHHYMNGGTRRMAVGAQREKYKLPSFHIREGVAVNLDVTAPGATLALGLMFFATNDPTVMNWMRPPDTKYLFGIVRPDLLLLRTIAHNLVCWDSIQPTQAWVTDQQPDLLIETVEIVQGLRDEQPSQTSLKSTMSRMERELYCQGYCAIACGSVVSIGLRYAGTANPVAAKTLYLHLRYFVALRHLKPAEPKQEPAEEDRKGPLYLAKLVGYQVLENCVLMTLLSLSLVLAGTGDLRVLRAVRMLRSRVNHPGVSYGSHMAVHMAVGFVCLGGGRYTLSRSPSAIAALLCSIFPKFPNGTNDNRYHLQALRHMYVLAIEPRLFVPRRFDNRKLVMCRIRYCLRASSLDTSDEPLIQKRMAPCMLPELDTLAWVELCDESFHTVRFDETNWSMLERILSKCACVDIVQHPGGLAALENHSPSFTTRMHYFAGKHAKVWQSPPEQLLPLISQPSITYLIRNILLSSPCYSLRAAIELRKDLPYATLAIHYFNELLTQCVKNDRFHAISILFDITNMILNPFGKEHRPTDTHQLQLMQTALSSQIPMFRGSGQILPGLLLYGSVLRACSGWTEDLKNYRAELQDLFGIFFRPHSPWFKRLAAHPQAIHKSGVKSRAHMLANVTRIIIMNMLPLDVISKERLEQLWPGNVPTRAEFVTKLLQLHPELPVSAITCLANIINLA